MRNSCARYTKCEFIMSYKENAIPDPEYIEKHLQSMFDVYDIKILTLSIEILRETTAELCFVNLEFHPKNLDAFFNIPIETKQSPLCCSIM